MAIHYTHVIDFTVDGKPIARYVMKSEVPRNKFKMYLIRMRERLRKAQYSFNPDAIISELLMDKVGEVTDMVSNNGSFIEIDVDGYQGFDDNYQPDNISGGDYRRRYGRDYFEIRKHSHPTLSMGDMLEAEDEYEFDRIIQTLAYLEGKYSGEDPNTPTNSDFAHHISRALDILTNYPSKE